MHKSSQCELSMIYTCKQDIHSKEKQQNGCHLKNIGHSDPTPDVRLDIDYLIVL